MQERAKINLWHIFLNVLPQGDLQNSQHRCFKYDTPYLAECLILIPSEIHTNLEKVMFSFDEVTQLLPMLQGTAPGFLCLIGNI